MHRNPQHPFKQRYAKFLPVYQNIIGSLAEQLNECGMRDTSNSGTGQASHLAVWARLELQGSNRKKKNLSNSTGMFESSVFQVRSTALSA